MDSDDGKKLVEHQCRVVDVVDDDDVAAALPGDADDAAVAAADEKQSSWRNDGAPASGWAGRDVQHDYAGTEAAAAGRDWELEGRSLESGSRALSLVLEVQ